MSIPITQIIKELETPETIIPIVKTLHHNVKKLHELPKSTLKHLISRIINLVSSHQPYYKWCGIILIQVVSSNYSILSANGVQMFGSVIKALESSSEPKIITSSIECLTHLCDQIRGKPTLTREVMTPKLPIIIQLFMDKIESYPELALKSINHIIINHPTTFRPFANKLNVKLLALLNSDFGSFSNNLKNVICQSFAILPLIEKNEPEVFWAQKFNNVLIEAVDILTIFNQLISIDQDKELTELMSKFKLESTPLFPSLQIDLSEPGSLVQLSNRLEVLLQLINAFLISPVKFPVRVPIGKIITVIEIIFNLNTKLIPFKRDIRDEIIKDTINSVILNIQFNCLGLLKVLASNYQLSLIMYTNNLFSILETSIPLSERLIDQSQLITNEFFYRELLDTVTSLLNLVNLYTDTATMVRFVDVSLFLIEPRSTGGELPSDTSDKKKKNKTSVPMADLLSHSHLFQDEIPVETIRVVRKFISCVISKMELPSNQYYKVMRYLIIEAIRCKQYHYNKYVPQELKSLLINSLIYPVSDKVSILPIISSIMGNDPLVSVFNNPRFPPLPILIRASIEEEGEEEEDDVPVLREPAKRVFPQDNGSPKRVKLDESGGVAGSVDGSVDGPIEKQPENIPIAELPVETVNEDLVFKPVDESKVMKFKESVPKVDVQVKVQTQAPQKRSIPQPNVSESVPKPIEAEEENNSDFEMPEINMDDSDDE